MKRAVFLAAGLFFAFPQLGVPVWAGGFTAEQAGAGGAVPEGVVINEVMSSNVVTLHDEDGATSDWIEIYNGGTSAVNFNGWGLTDDPGNLKKWTFPDFVVPPNDFALIFASDKDKLGFIGPIPVLHTNFKISSNGETIVLSTPQGEIVDRVATGALPEDISIGRQPSGSGAWQYFDHPTPREPNVPFSYTGFAAEPFFIQVPGFYPAALSVELTVANGQIFYTLDGSDPTPAATLYTVPLTVSQTTVIRARTLGEGLMPSKIKTGTYFVNRPTNGMAVISLITDPQNLWDPQDGLFNEQDTITFLRTSVWPEIEKEFHIEFYEPDGVRGFSQNVGVKLTGVFSRVYPQKSLAVFARNEFGPKDIDYPIFSDMPQIMTYESFVLRNGGNDWPSATFRDDFMQTLIRGVDLDHQDSRPAVVYLNGQYWGKYNIREKINEHFIAAHHPVDPNNIDMLEGGCLFDEEAGQLRCAPQILHGDADHFANLVNFIRTHDLALKENYDYLQTQMEVNNFTSYFVSEIFYANRDWPFNNMRYWRPKTPDGRWRWILFDTDFAFGRSSDAGWNVDTITQAGKYNLFFKELLKNADFRRDFILTFADYLNTYFEPSRVVALVNRMTGEVAAEMPAHIARWKDLGTCPFLQLTELPLEVRQKSCEDLWVSLDSEQKWNWEVDVLRQFAQLRPDFMRDLLTQRFGLNGKKFQLNIHVAAPDSGKVRLNGHVDAGDGFSGTYFSDFPVQLSAVPAPGYRFLGWSQDVTSRSGEITVEPAGAVVNLTATFTNQPPQFIRGDADSNGTVNLTDAIYILNYLFRNGEVPVCQDAVDTNDDGGVDISDPVRLLFFLFGNDGATMPSPSPLPGVDPTGDNLLCGL